MHPVKLRAILSALLLIVVHVAHAQQVTITGRVIDAEGSPVPFATVILSTDSLSVKGMLYAVASNEGTFKIENVSSAPPYRWVAVRSVGFKNYLAKRKLSELKDVTIKLEAIAEDIDQVVVKGKARDIVEKEDTVVYNTAYFRKGNEKSLADVVRNMPGMQVDAAGNVSYQGKQVGKVLVNGQDVLPTSTGAAMKTLPADFAKSVEVLTDYTDGDIAKDFQADKQLALNLKTEKSIKVSGNIEAGGGIFNKYYGKGALITMFPYVSTSLLTNVNNIGSAVMSTQEYYSRVVGYSSIMGGSVLGVSTVTLSEEERALLTTPKNLYTNVNGMGNFNLTWTPKVNYQLKSNSIYTKSLREGSSNQYAFYNLGENSSFEKYTNAVRRQSPQLFSQLLSQRWIVTRRLSLKSKTRFDYSTGDLSRKYEERYLSNHVNALSKELNKSIKVTQVLELNSLIDRGLLVAGVTFNYDKALTTNNVSSDLVLLSGSLYPVEKRGNEYAYLANRLRKDWSANAIIGYTYPLPLKSVFIKSELSYTYAAENRHISLTSREKWEESMFRHEPKIYLGLMKNKGFVKFGGGLYLAGYEFEMNPAYVTSGWKWALEPVARMELTFSRTNSLGFSASRKLERITLADLTRTRWINDYDDATNPSEVTIAYSEKISGSIVYRYQSNFRRIFLLGILNYYHAGHIAQTRTVYQNNALFTTDINGGQLDNLYGNFYLSKGLIDIPFELKVRSTYTAQWFRLMQAEVQEYMQVHDIMSSLTINSQFYNSPVNFSIQGYYNFNTDLIEPRDFISQRHYTGGEAEIFLSIKNFDFSVGGSVDYLMNTATKERIVYDAKCSASYTWRKFTFEVTGEKLLHLKRFEWTGQSLSSYVRKTNFYRRMPGYVLATVRYNF